MLVVVGAILLVLVRVQESSDPEICPRVDPDYRRAIAVIEDRGVTNQFSAMGTFKPGLVRRWTAIFLLWIVDYAARHIYPRGQLARVQTIHFARWVYLDGNGACCSRATTTAASTATWTTSSTRSAFGLNFVFSNGVGYPKTRWLIVDGGKTNRSSKTSSIGISCRRRSGTTRIPARRRSTSSATRKSAPGSKRAALCEREARAWVALL